MKMKSWLGHFFHWDDGEKVSLLTWNHLDVQNTDFSRYYMVMLFLSTNIYRAAHQGASLHSPSDDAEEVGWSFFQLIHLCHSTGEVLKPLRRGASGKSLVAAVQPVTFMITNSLHNQTRSWSEVYLWKHMIEAFLLCICLLHQGAPELCSLSWVDEKQLPISDRQPVVNHHIHPVPKLPKLENPIGYTFCWV